MMPRWLKDRLLVGMVLWVLIGIGWCVWKAVLWVIGWFH